MNIQTIPREDKIVKKAFMPKLDNFLFLDYSNIELRILAYYMVKAVKDASMALVFIEGQDLHIETAKALFEVEQPTDRQRQMAKTFNFSIVYGGGRPTIMRQLNIDEEAATVYLNNYHAQWPGIKKLQRLVMETVEHKKFIRTAYGRRLHPEKPYKALNALIQGTAADLMRSSLTQIDAFLSDNRYESHLVATVHDSAILDCMADEVPYLTVVLPALMSDPMIDNVVPIEISVSTSSTNWAEEE